MTAAHLLEVSDLHTVFSSREGAVRAVAGVSFHVDRGETLGIVGESGCGKSATALSIMRLLEHPGRIVSGSIRLEGTELTSLPESAMQQVRGARIAMIFQDPLTSMNPGYRVGWQVAEPLRLHRSKNRAQAGAGGGRDAQARRDPRGGGARERVPAPVLGRDAPAGDDRHGPRRPRRRC